MGDMADIWRALFGPKIEAGQGWVFVPINGGNPFAKDDSWPVKVFRVEQGWVEYRDDFGNYRHMKVRSFRFCYRLVPDEAQPA